ncbi:MAG: DUF4445 domain-containing protein [Clostridia bacterium]|nr:DUF4445 domain-containing protein [Clostridia bacterium]
MNQEEKKLQQYTVTFLPAGLNLTVTAGSSVLTAAAQAGLALKSSCGGSGTCGQCIIKVVSGQVQLTGGNLAAQLKQQGYTLACQTLIYGDVVLEIPATSLLAEHRVFVADKGRLPDSLTELPAEYPLQPVCETVSLKLPEPSLTENACDMDRLLTNLQRQKGLKAEVGLQLLQNLPQTLRDSNWQVEVTYETEVNRILRIAAAGSSRSYGLAIDLGTTTVVASLLDLSNGIRVARKGTYNRQAAYGDDLISRVIHACETNDGLDALRQSALTTINGLIEDLLVEVKVAPAEVVAATIAGNTIMIHLLLGISPKFIRLQPYIPAAAEWPPMNANEVGLNINPLAPVYIFPAVASYVGGDIVAGVIFSQMAQNEHLNLFIDIGTNGEMVLGNDEWLIACACSAGPAFEGSGISNGMRAMSGAIEAVNIDPQTNTIELEVIGGGAPAGICGSGLIDCLAKLRRTGVIDRSGNFIATDNPRVRPNDEGYEFVLTPASESKTGQDIVITSADIKTLIRSKGAVYAGIQSLLKTVSLELDAIDKIIIAGGFGNYLNIANAVEIGLLPDLPPEKFVFAGNAALKGAELALLSRPAWQQALELARKITYLELSSGNLFMEEFVAALFLPHTRLELFPSLVDAKSNGHRQEN